MDREFWELEKGKVLDDIELFALTLNLRLVVSVDREGKINKHYDFLRHVPFARCDN